jgi:hypothetical protein
MGYESCPYLARIAQFAVSVVAYDESIDAGLTVRPTTPTTSCCWCCSFSVTQAFERSRVAPGAAPVLREAAALSASETPDTIAGKVIEMFREE